MSKVTLHSLSSDGTYRRERAVVKDKYVQGRSEGSTVTITRRCVFDMAKPVPFDTIEGLLAADAPAIPLVTWGQRCVLRAANDIHSIRYEEREADAAGLKEANALMWSRIEWAIYTGAKGDQAAQARFLGVMALAGASAFVAVMLSVVVGLRALG